jgi:transcriptional regulator with XRE-family HTH domain
MSGRNDLLRDLRHAKGLTQQQVVDHLQDILAAEGTNVAPAVRLVTDWEAGRTTWPHPHYRRALRTLFDVVDDAALGFHLRGAATTTPRVLMHVLDPKTEDPVKRQTFLTGIAAVAMGAADGQPLQPWLGLERSRSARPSMIGADDVAAIHRTAQQFSSWDHTRGGASCTDAALAQLNWASTLLDKGRFADDTVRRHMCTAVSYLANVAGFAAFDAGQHPDARRALALAVHSATEAGDQPLRADALATLALQAITLGQPRQALDLTALAVHGSRDAATPALRARMHAITARAHARAGDLPATLAQIAAAEDTYAPPGPHAPTWLQFYQRPYVTADCAAATFDAAAQQGTLRGAALARYTTAAASFGPTAPRATALQVARIAALHFAADDIEPAVDQTRAFIAQADGINSARLRERRTELARQAGRHRTAPDVADLIHALSQG